MFAALLTLSIGAPVPKVPPARPTPPVANHPAVPGFRWFYYEDELESLGLDEAGSVVYRCVSCPGKVWGMGADGVSRQSLATTWAEVNTHPQKPPVVRDRYQPFTLTWGEP